MLDPQKFQTKSKTTKASKTTKNSLSPTAMSSDSFCVAWIHKKSKEKMKDLPRMCGFQAATVSTSNKKGTKVVLETSRSRNWDSGTSPNSPASQPMLQHKKSNYRFKSLKKELMNKDLVKLNTEEQVIRVLECLTKSSTSVKRNRESKLFLASSCKSEQGEDNNFDLSNGKLNNY